MLFAMTSANKSQQLATGQNLRATASAPMTLAQARRIAIAAQGLIKGKPEVAAGARGIAKVFDQLQLVQIDSVNVLSRSHYLPFFARLGNYDREILNRFSSTHPRKMVEYWAHEASFIKPEHFADMRSWQRRSWFGNNPQQPEQTRELSLKILRVLEAGRAMTARQVSERVGYEKTTDRSNWGWNWNPVKECLERLFIAGDVSVAARNEQFERRYTPTGRIFRSVASDATERTEGIVRLTEAAARAHGIGTVRCFADYFRLPVRDSAVAVAELLDTGVLERVSVRGWDADLFLHHEAAKPRVSRARALLSPFDSLVFERRRLLDLFEMHYRIGIYTPAEKRTHGYYVLPFLLREEIVARVDLKADRAASRLLVRTAFAEPNAPADTATELAAELRLMAQWLELADVVVEPVGNLADKLAAAIKN